MKRIKYILKKLRTIQYKNMYTFAKKISKTTKKATILIMIDMMASALKYGCGYMDYFEFEFYLLNSKQRRTYITGAINNEIIKKYNDKEFFYKFSNKVEFNKIFNKYLGRKWIYLKESSVKDFKEFLKNKNKICVKPIDDCGGKGVQIINVNKDTDEKKLYNKLIRNNQLLVEEVIVQNKRISELYANSVNTLRIITFRTKKEVVVLKTIFKLGNSGSIDNFSSGGMYTFADETGKVFVPAIDEKGNIFDKHPVSQKEIVNFQIPLFDKVIELVKELGKIVPEVRYVGWDIAITQDKAVVIEGNEFSGIFQVKPSISGIKTGDLPNYRKYMDI